MVNMVKMVRLLVNMVNPKWEKKHSQQQIIMLFFCGLSKIDYGQIVDLSHQKWQDFCRECRCDVFWDLHRDMSIFMCNMARMQTMIHCMG